MMKKWVASPLDKNILIYKNPRRVIFQQLRKRSNITTYSESLMESIFLSFPFFLVFVITTILHHLDNQFIFLWFAFFFTIFSWELFAINLYGFKSKRMAEIIPRIVWLSDYVILFLVGQTKKKRIIVRNYYNTKLTIQLPPFFFLDYSLSGDWANYKRISIKRMVFSWVFEITLKRIAKEGQLTLIRH
jgi:hypothetical protein